MNPVAEEDNEVYCWLKQQLEPRFQVTADPGTSYFSEFLYRYDVRDGDRRVARLEGDFRVLLQGELRARAVELVQTLQSADDPAHRSQPPALRPRPAEPVMAGLIASRLPPRRTGITYFSSGRAAFSWLLSAILQPTRVWLPTYVCWSLVSTLQNRFPYVNLRFYSVNRQLGCTSPTDAQPGDTIVRIHYFGRAAAPLCLPEGCILIDDFSHVLILPPVATEGFAFGSLRKTCRIADGGFLHGSFNPQYEPDRGSSQWLRLEARDWRDLREAENMTDRCWNVSDMSSQSLAAMREHDVAAAASQRRRNQQYLARHFPVGQPLIDFRQEEVPLLHNVILPDSQQRESLRQFLAGRRIFCSVHWPVHPLLLQHQDQTDITDAVWLAEHLLSIPVADDFSEVDMERICHAADAWQRSA